QFFPDKRAIVWALAERYTAESQACISAALRDVSDAQDLKRAFSELLDIYYRLFLAEPVIRDVWFGTQADKALRALEMADSRANAEFLVAVLKRLRPDADPMELETAAFLVWQMGEAAVRLAISVDREEGDRLVEAYKRMALRELVGE
ncbi:TetR/AcrR family transcriptional regulator, partial [uncultured Mesorhizobium sp.]